jgi:hypothetical protein
MLHAFTHDAEHCLDTLTSMKTTYSLAQVCSEQHAPVEQGPQQLHMPTPSSPPAHAAQSNHYKEATRFCTSTSYRNHVDASFMTPFNEEDCGPEKAVLGVHMQCKNIWMLASTIGCLLELALAP